MDAAFREMLVNRNQAALKDAYFDNSCRHFFTVDWREDDADVVGYCANCLGLSSLSADWRDDALVITFEGKERPVALVMDVADRHTTVCALNDVLSPGFEIRFIVCSFGSDTLGFAALSVADWQALEQECPAAVAENFIDPRELPNLMTELTAQKLDIIVERIRRR